MAEFSPAEGARLDGRVINGRTVRRPDGTYESLDLCETTTEVGGVVVLTVGNHEDEVRLERLRPGSAMEGWSYAEQEPSGQGAALARTALNLCLLDREGFLTPRVVLRTGLSIGVTHVNDPDRPANVLTTLGAIHEIRYIIPEEADMCRLVDEAFEGNQRLVSSQLRAE